MSVSICRVRYDASLTHRDPYLVVRCAPRQRTLLIRRKKEINLLQEFRNPVFSKNRVFGIYEIPHSLFPIPCSLSLNSSQTIALFEILARVKLIIE